MLTFAQGAIAPFWVGTRMSKPKPFVAPRVIVREQFPDGKDVVTVVAGSLRPYNQAHAPAALYDLETERVKAFPLHKLVGVDADVWTFRTYEQGMPVEQIIGQSYVFRPWWSQSAWELSRDSSRVWTKKALPDDGSHEHCEFTYVHIPNDDSTMSYESDGIWITSEAYERFIIGDEYHCRE